MPPVELDGRSFWPQCLGDKGNPRQFIYQYYYPKYKPAGVKHGQGVRSREVIWAQNQYYKLFQDGSFYAVTDRYEVDPIRPGDGTQFAEETRKMLQRAIDAMPQTGLMLNPEAGP